MTGNLSVQPQLDPNLKLLTSCTTSTRFSPAFRQIFAASASILCAVSIGTVVGYSAILLPQIYEDGRFNFTSEHESWIAAGVTLPMAPSCILGGLFMEAYGRKLSNILVNIPLIVGWTFMYFSNGFEMFLCGRLLQGISLGISGPLNSVFIGETSDPKYRGLFLAGVSLGYTFGILFTHLIGTYCRWKITSLLCISISLVTMAAFIFVPESPLFLLSKDKINDAFKSFGWLRGYGIEAASEFNNMLANQDPKDIKSFSKIFANMKQSNFYKPLFILLAMFFLLQFVGVNIVAFYTVSIMRETVGGIYDEYLTMILIDIVRFMVAIVTCIVINKIRRKLIFILSGLGTGICLILFSAFIYLSQYCPELKKLPFVPVTLILGYICFSSLGLLPLPWCLIGELFPKTSRGLGSGIASAGNFMFFFIVIKIAPSLFSFIGIEGAFLLFGCVGLSGTIALSRIFPETHNRTLQEIEEKFKKKPDI